MWRQIPPQHNGRAILMRNVLASILLITCLASCATFGQLETGLKSLMGHDAQTAFDALGYPSGKMNFGTDTVYYWAINRSGTLVLPQTSTTSGYVGSTPVYGSTTYNQVVPVNYNCQIKLIADSNGTLKSWEYEGNIGGCQSYISRLKGFATEPRSKLEK